jgi:ADP-ribose pyrophosphatase
MDFSQRPPRTTGSRQVFTGRVFSVRQDDVRWDDGALAQFDIVEHRGSVAIIALTADGALVMVHQYRHPAARFLWELPAGVIEPGEDAIGGALRELAEETGFRASRARSLGACYPTPGYCSEVLHFVLAEGLVGGQQHLDPDERLAARAYSIDDVGAMAGRGEIADAKTLLAIAWLRGSRDQLLGASSDITGVGDAVS